MSNTKVEVTVRFPPYVDAQRVCKDGKPGLTVSGDPESVVSFIKSLQVIAEAFCPCTTTGGTHRAH